MKAVRMAVTNQKIGQFFLQGRNSTSGFPSGWFSAFVDAVLCVGSIVYDYLITHKK